VRWVDRGEGREEVLVSISTDGRVSQWGTAKGLEHSDLMRLKRLARTAPAAAAAAAPLAAGAASAGPGAGKAAAAGAGKGRAAAAGEHDALVSRHSGGMSFDFSARDHRIYLAGTEDGWIHRCSSSYGDQYLESYRGHMGPVYALQVRAAAAQQPAGACTKPTLAGGAPCVITAASLFGTLALPRRCAQQSVEE
jgi:hypothetical protein